MVLTSKWGRIQQEIQIWHVQVTWRCVAVRELPKDVLKMASGLISPSGWPGHRRQLCTGEMGDSRAVSEHAPAPTLHLVKLDWPGQSLHLHHLHVVHQTVAVLPRGLGVAVKGGHHDLGNIYILLMHYIQYKLDHFIFKDSWHTNCFLHELTMTTVLQLFHIHTSSG